MSGAEFLQDFYTTHHKLLTYDVSSISNESFSKSIDSILVLHCTPKLLKLARMHFIHGRDYMTLDLGSAEQNTNLRIEPLDTKKNIYIVSFDALYTDSPGGPKTQRVALHVRLIQESGAYKIAQIESAG